MINNSFFRLKSGTVARDRKLFPIGLVILTLIALSFAARAEAVNSTTPMVQVNAAVNYDTSPPLREISPSPVPAGRQVIPLRRVSHVPIISPTGDGALQPQTFSLRAMLASFNAGLSFDGVGEGFAGPAGPFTVTFTPACPNGAVGATQFVQWVNDSFSVFDKAAGNATYGPAAGHTLWTGFGGPCETSPDSGDIIAQYDKAANRWVMMQPVYTSPYYLCVAVSTTSDATGTYYRYAFPAVGNLVPDYPKLGVWPDGYYVSYNQFSNRTSSAVFEGPAACVLDRNNMLLGNPATMHCFTGMGASYGSLLPSDLDGTNAPPPGSSDYFMSLSLNSSSLYMWKFHVDWATPANSTFNGPTIIPVASFSEACGGGACIPQNGTSQTLDSTGDRLMYRLAYRNFGDHESLVANHSAAANGGVGVRWYEIRSPGTTPTVYQQSTYAPDSNYRWVGSVAMDKVGNMAVGYSVSGSLIYPSIAFTGRLSTDTLDTLQSETTIIAGSGSQLTTYRWGDYTSMSVDPVDDCTFWYTNQYLKSSGDFNWSTRIYSFSFPSCTTAPPTFSIAGTVTTSTGSPLAGVTVKLSGAASAATTTDSNGNYSFAGLINGTYKITSGLTGYTFSPVSISAAINNANVTGQNFTAKPLAIYSISGSVTTSGNRALTGVIIRLMLNGTVVRSSYVDGNGNYIFGSLANGAYTVTPSLTGYTFSPVSITADLIGASLAGQNFTGTSSSIKTYSISGTVKTSTGSLLAGVTVKLSGAASATGTTDNNGNYIFAGLVRGTYTVAPALTGYAFSPTSITTAINSANVTGQNFTAAATVKIYSISGAVATSTGSPLAGVPMKLSGAATAATTTDSNGNYSFAALANGTYTVTPNLTGYAFSPINIPVTVSSANVAGQNFTATALPTYLISGTVTTSTGSTLAGVTVKLSGAASAATTTDSNGNYSFAGLLNGTYKVIPSLTGYAFSPASITVTVNSADVAGQNFSASASLPRIYSLSGSVTTSGGSPLTGVIIRLMVNGAVVRSSYVDGNGNYIFGSLSSGSYTVTPSLPGDTFTPTSAAATINNANVTVPKFVGN